MSDILINALAVGTVGVFAHMWLNWLVDTALKEVEDHELETQPLDDSDTW